MFYCNVTQYKQDRVMPITPVAFFDIFGIEDNSLVFSLIWPAFSCVWKCDYFREVLFRMLLDSLSTTGQLTCFVDFLWQQLSCSILNALAHNKALNTKSYTPNFILKFHIAHTQRKRLSNKVNTTRHEFSRESHCVCLSLNFIIAF